MSVIGEEQGIDSLKVVSTSFCGEAETRLLQYDGSGLNFGSSQSANVLHVPSLLRSQFHSYTLTMSVVQAFWVLFLSLHCLIDSI